MIINLIAYLKQNPMILGSLTLYLTGLLGYATKSLPLKLWTIITSQLQTTIQVSSVDDIYFQVLDWATSKKAKNQIRNFSFMSKGRYGTSKPEMLFGFGTFYFIYDYKLFSFTRAKEESKETYQRKETLTLTVFNRNYKLFEMLLSELKKELEDDTDTTSIFGWTDSWQHLSKNFKRPLDSVVLDSKTREKLIKHIDNFHTLKEFYKQNGILWKTGILLYGPPGTGKTSIIKGLASKYDKNIAILTPDSLMKENVEQSLKSLGANIFLAIEDVDGCSDTHNREKTTEQSPFKKSNIANLLNVLDGLNSAEGTIIIATTNHIEKLDPALIRPGRFDLVIEIGYLTDETYRAYLKRFYTIPNIDSLKVKEKITPASLQNLVLANLSDYTPVLKELSA